MKQGADYECDSSPHPFSAFPAARHSPLACAAPAALARLLGHGGVNLVRVHGVIDISVNAYFGKCLEIEKMARPTNRAYLNAEWKIYARVGDMYSEEPF